jgi:anthraniloyl-CoA monooxygenase
MVRDWTDRLAVARHRWPERRLGLQLHHAGPRGACHPPDRGVDDPLPPQRSWPLGAASAHPYGPGFPRPRQLDRSGMQEVTASFEAAAVQAAELGVDWLELQFGQGYLLATFLSPRTNRRNDGYGGTVDRRLRFPLEVLIAVRRAWPRTGLLAVAVNADDGGTPEDRIMIARALHGAGADLLTVVSGHTTWHEAPACGRVSGMFAAGRLRNEHGIRTMCTGGIAGADDVRTVLLSGRADYARLDSVSRIR